MSEDFDPYYKWLGIPPKDQPPTHYRLLSIETFESDRQVIDSAANRLMAYLKTLSTGDDATHAQQLLNEAAAARRVLLDPQLKLEYDARLRGTEAVPPPASVPSPAPPSVPVSPAAPRPAQALPVAKSLAGAAKSLRSTSVPSLPTGGGDLRSSSIVAAKKLRAQRREEAARQGNLIVWTSLAAAGLVAFLLWLSFAGSSRQGDGGDRPSRPPADRPPERKRSDADESPRRPAPAPAEVRRSDPPPALSRPSASAVAGSAPAKSERRENEPKDESPSEVAESRPSKPLSPEAAREDPVMEGLPAANIAGVPPRAGLPAVNPGSPASTSAGPKPDRAVPPAPAGDPFAGLGAALKMPPYAKVKPGEQPADADLGPLPLADLKEVRFTVLGAGEVFGRMAIVSLIPVDPSRPDRWRVEIHEGAQAAQAVAEFRLHDGRLRFRWLPDADFARADLLRSCFLEIAVRQNSRRIALRRPQVVKALTIQNEKGAPQTHAIAVAGIPQGLPWQIEVGGTSGPVPYYTLCQPPLPGTARKPISIRWTTPESPHPIYVQVSLEMVTANGFSILTRLLAQAPSERNPKEDKGFISKSEAGRIKKLIVATESYVAGHPSLGPAVQGKPPANPQAIADYEKKFPQQKQVFDLLRHLQCLDALSVNKNLREKVRIHFKIFTVVGGQRLDLVQTAPETPEKK